ncbi:MAG TPA: phosphoribosylanthranilate isomerase [Candidatus Acidoferrales bacterium]|nr:phosphoribosylanthranilate isomerase [Candidatus Acidoferrales bacterium]
MRGTIVKVCGLTQLVDARAAVEAGADWLGFIVSGESPRRIEVERAAEIVAALPGVTAVAVMVDVAPERALGLATRMGASRVQLHRADAARWPRDFPLPSAFAIGVAGDGALAGALPHEAHLLMLDAAHATLAGGTGRLVPWDAARRHAAARPVLLAGGLSPDNVAAAIEAVRPFGVDASSGLERSPGIKDPERVRRFVAAVRECDERIRDHA